MDTIAPLASIGMDIGKDVFHVVGFGTDGKIAFRRKIKRLALVETFKRLPSSVVAGKFLGGDGEEPGRKPRATRRAVWSAPAYLTFFGSSRQPRKSRAGSRSRRRSPGQ